MQRVRLFAVAAAVVAAGLALTAAPADAQPAGPWASVKGQVVLPAGVAIPERKKLDVSQDKEHCLSKGDILDEKVIVNPKNRGVKNVVVWLRPDDPKDIKAKLTANQIHPDDKNRKKADVVIDQPCCMFLKRVTAARVGDTIVAKNPAPVPHNFFWSSSNNGEFNVAIAKESDWKMPQELTAEASAISFRCTIHPWMSGWVKIFDHPYYAVTDDDGKFEIKNAPVGNFRIVYWQEEVGLKGGAPGRFGEVINIAAPATELKPTDFDVTPKKQ